MTTDGSAFTAQWAQDRLGRPGYVRAAGIAGVEGNAEAVGVELVEGTAVHRMVNRFAKYGLPVVALAFSASLLFKLASGVEVRLFQYGLLGASLSLLALLLLAVGEVAGYGAGYALGAVPMVGQASLYSLSVTRRARPAVLFATMLSAVFTFLHLLLGPGTYPLLVGTVALFVVLSPERQRWRGHRHAPAADSWRASSKQARNAPSE